MCSGTETFCMVGNRDKIQRTTQLHSLAPCSHQGLAFGETVGILDAEFVAHYAGINTLCCMQM